MSTYKLYYFNIRGRGEVSRYLFKLADQQFEDIRYSFGEWPEKKSDSPFGQLPYMEVDGQTICQTRAIERLLAKRFNRYGSTDMEQAWSDMVVDCVEDMGQNFFRASGGDDEGKAERKKKWVEESLQSYLEKLEKFATPTGFIAGKTVMWVDLAFFSVVDFLGAFALDGQKLDLEKTPKLQAIRDLVAADPKIAAWIEARPKTDM